MQRRKVLIYPLRLCVKPFLEVTRKLANCCLGILPFAVKIPLFLYTETSQ